MAEPNRPIYHQATALNKNRPFIFTLRDKDRRVSQGLVKKKKGVSSPQISSSAWSYLPLLSPDSPAVSLSASLAGLTSYSFSSTPFYSPCPAAQCLLGPLRHSIIPLTTPSLHPILSSPSLSLLSPHTLSLLTVAQDAAHSSWSLAVILPKLFIGKVG